MLREYLRLLPLGYCVAAQFISLLHVPVENGFAELIGIPLDTMLERGGPAVDRELAALLYDIYKLQRRFSVDNVA